MGKIIDLDNLLLYDEFIKAYILQQKDNTSFIISESSYKNFPAIGKENTLYIDCSENQLYRWSDEKLSYFLVGNNFEQLLNGIEVINGLGKE